MGSKQKPVTFDTWHRRLGHVGAGKLCEMISQDLVDGLNVQGELNMSRQCEDCIFGKHTTHPFNGKGDREKELLERIHLDIWGPAQMKSAGGALYFLVLMDGFSSYRTVTFLSEKSADSTLKVFQTYLTEAERQTGKRIKRIRLDMGREWLNHAWETYRKEKGLIFEFTTPYAHQQNGAAERSMRTILDSVHSMMAESGMPMKYWADAVQTTIYTRNLVPSSRRPGSIPAELWFGKRQDILHLRPFGTTAYAHILLDLNLSKLYPRSVKVSLLGYFGRELYKLLERASGTIFKSRDVIFEEGITHFSSQPKPTIFSEDNDPFVYKQNPEKPPEIGTANKRDPEKDQSNNNPLFQGIAPRPMPISDLHKDEETRKAAYKAPNSTQIPETSSQNNLEQPEPPKQDIDMPLAIRRPRREPKPSSQLIESREYLNRPSVFATNTDTWVPKTFYEAMKRPDLWWSPMVQEFEMLKERAVFELVPRPIGKNVVGSKWVYAVKWKENGEVEKRKARTVAKGYTQVIGEDYDETYASVAHLESVRLVCAIAASRRLRLWQVDFVSAFLNSDSSFEVYMEQPQGFEEGGGDYVWRLRKILYSTMQGAHDWTKNLDKMFESHGYYKSWADPQIRSRVYDNEFTLISTWTDDILGTSSTVEGETLAKTELRSSYEVKDLGEAKLILGMRIDRNKNGDVTLSQRAYCERLLKHFNMTECTPSTTPLPIGLSLSIEDCP